MSDPSASRISTGRTRRSHTLPCRTPSRESEERQKAINKQPDGYYEQKRTKSQTLGGQDYFRNAPKLGEHVEIGELGYTFKILETQYHDAERQANAAHTEYNRIRDLPKPSRSDIKANPGCFVKNSNYPYKTRRPVVFEQLAKQAAVVAECYEL